MALLKEVGEGFCSGVLLQVDLYKKRDEIATSKFGVNLKARVLKRPAAALPVAALHAGDQTAGHDGTGHGRHL